MPLSRDVVACTIDVYAGANQCCNGATAYVRHDPDNRPAATLDDDAVHFSGIRFYRLDDDNMVGYIVFRNGDEVREEKLVYRRN